MSWRVAPQCLDWIDSLLDAHNSEHLFGWLAGTRAHSASLVLRALPCLEYSERSALSDAAGLSAPDVEAEHNALRRLLPLGIDVLGCYVTCTGDAEEVVVDRVAPLLCKRAAPLLAGDCALVCAVAVGEAAALENGRWFLVDLKRESVSSVPVAIDKDAALSFAERYVAVFMQVASSSLPVQLWRSHGGSSDGAVYTTQQLASQRKTKVGAFFGVRASAKKGSGFVAPRCGAVWRALHKPLVSEEGPSLLYGTVSAEEAENGGRAVSLCLYIEASASVGDAFKLLHDCATDKAQRDSLLYFQPYSLPFAIAVRREATVKEKEAAAARFRLPFGATHFARCLTCVWSSFDDGSHLLNVHETLAQKTGLAKGSRVAMVWGFYEYRHYQQDGVNDEGWGCAYRSLQTLCSWLRLQGYTERPVPSHAEIQRTLVALEDKEAAFVGSRQWIGAIEVSMILSHLYGVDCRIISVTSGAQLESKVDELQQHFREEGTPVMVGGGVLAYTLLGVARDVASGQVRWLILDPHYVGKDALNAVLKSHWVAWKTSKIWRKDAFYNLCCPLRPRK